MLASTQGILIIATPHDAEQFQGPPGAGSQFGVKLTFAQHPSSDGLAQAFVIDSNFIGDGKVVLVLGDNFLDGPGLGPQLKRYTDVDGGTVFAYRMAGPNANGVVEFDNTERAVPLQEEPTGRRSNCAILGL